MKKSVKVYHTQHANGIAGVYLWVIRDEIVYIGETADIAQRFNTGYGTFHPGTAL